jgi:hypothetical protein
LSSFISVHSHVVVVATEGIFTALAARTAFLLFLRGLRHRRRLGHGFVHVDDEVTQHRRPRNGTRP